MGRGSSYGVASFYSAAKVELTLLHVICHIYYRNEMITERCIFFLFLNNIDVKNVLVLLKIKKNSWVKIYKNYIGLLFASPSMKQSIINP